MTLDMAPWTGGSKPPVPAGTPVLVLHRDGNLYASPAGKDYAESWEHVEDHSDILAYHIIQGVAE